jgi:hypothetical protein
MFNTALAPLPACNVLGVTAVPTASVYTGETAITVMGVRVTVCVRAPETPVTVTVYCAGVVVPVVVNVSEGEDGGVEVDGLTAQVGALVD